MLGKVFTMAYSVVGIPLALIMFQVKDLFLNTVNVIMTLKSIGERMNKCSSIIIQSAGAIQVMTITPYAD